MRIGMILLKLRKERRLSQAEVAFHLNISQSTYSAWESDRSLPNIRCYVNLAEVFGITITDLTSQINGLQQNHSASQPLELDGQLANEELISTQKRLIMLQHQRIENLEDENRQLRQQIQYIEKC